MEGFNKKIEFAGLRSRQSFSLELKADIIFILFKPISMQKGFLLLLLLVGSSIALSAQDINKIITASEVGRIEKVLSSDAMQGRKTFSPGIAAASAFIENEFKQTGLQFLPGLNSYRQVFYMAETKNNTADVTIDGVAIADSNLAVISFAPNVNLSENDSVEIVHLDSAAELRSKIGQIFGSAKNQLVLADNSLKRFAGRLVSMGSSSMDASPKSIVIVFGVKKANEFSIKLNNTITKKELNNVAGVIPGKTKPDEYVVFSGHYDHLGIGEPDATGDSIYNGANDDAAGTTAVIMLAKYFKALNNNARSLIFVTFTAEEIGGFGSEYFSNQLDPSKVMAMFNIEMIGTESKWGTNSAYITGYEKTDMGKILEKNLEGSKFKFYPDPYPEQQLFYRSDNATLARKGVPAHTISTSKMDSEKYYHTQKDEFETLDLDNMAEIMKAIAASSVSIISGKDTPSRVNTSELR